ncbi:GGDEF domain-containing protein [Marinomonas atlantica]|uniref:GGDEF domain-containing protein n=1 Tax=Marinomonas atlantica TaxID=1806668 RepID=UPI0008360B86|nr:GGDEF domain-containing protein [Marinomonas atlantica]
MADFFIITKALKDLYNNSQRLVDNESSTLQLINVNGLIAHLCFIILFILIDIKWLAIFNVVSVMLWCVSIFCTIKGRYRFSILLIACEISAHAFAATTTMGLASGFQLYLWPAVLLMCILPARYHRSAMACLTLIIAPLLLLNIFAPFEKEAYQDTYSWLYVFNLISASLPFIFTAIVVRMIFVSHLQRMEYRAYNDELTQLVNRRRGYEILNIAASKNQSIYIALGDIDYFKRINDSLGHLKGDEVLQGVARLFSQYSEGKGTCCRWGGEEFLFIFIDQPYPDVLSTMERLCQDVPLKIQVDGLDSPITCSFGLIKLDKQECLEDALSEVDKLLYQAKNTGRSKVVHK